MTLGGGVGAGDSTLGAVPEERRKKSGAELRELWRKAILQQILLLRMEKENQKLQGKTQTKHKHTCSLIILISAYNLPSNPATSRMPLQTQWTKMKSIMLLILVLGLTKISSLVLPISSSLCSPLQWNIGHYVSLFKFIIITFVNVNIILPVQDSTFVFNEFATSRLLGIMWQ